MSEEKKHSHFWVWFFLGMATCDNCSDRWSMRAAKARIAELEDRVSQVVPRDAGTEER